MEQEPRDKSEDPIEQEQQWELKFWHVLAFLMSIVLILWLIQAYELHLGALKQ